MRSLKVLALVESGLPEVESVLAGYTVHTLASPSDPGQVNHAVRSSGCHILHVVGHGAPGGAVAVGGLTLVPHELAWVSVRSRMRLVVLAACHSIVVGARLFGAGIPNVIAWPGVVSEAARRDFCATFYRTLRLTGSVTKAYVAGIEFMSLFYKEEEYPVLLNGRYVTTPLRMWFLYLAAVSGWLAAGGLLLLHYFGA